MSMDRRSLLGASMGAAAAAVIPAAAQAGRKKRFAIVGVGSRARMYQTAIWGPHKDTAQLVAACDTNPGRLQLLTGRATAAKVAPPKLYAASDFGRMVHETRPDALIVTTPDALHDEYLVRALEAGMDAITEKPMTTDAGKARRILDACRRTGRHIRVTFNYRYAPFRTQIKEMLMAGAIGDVLSVDFTWLLNTVHGADYFRRWHSNKAISGGLMVHKATHHFDLVNWWLSAQPTHVTARGKRDFYTPAMAKRMGLQSHHERCRTCPEKAKCTFFLDLTADAGLKSLYADQEHHDGYYRDRCVWRPDISIEDTMNVIVDYDSGAQLSYALNAFNSWEGYHIAFNGTKGRIEHSLVEAGGTAGASQAGEAEDVIETRLIPLRGKPRVITPRTGVGSHSGGDAVMLNDLFGTSVSDPTMRAADERGGAASVLIGIAANECFRTGRPVEIANLVPNLPRPDLPPMPSRDRPLPMPPRV